MIKGWLFSSSGTVSNKRIVKKLWNDYLSYPGFEDEIESEVGKQKLKSLTLFIDAALLQQSSFSTVLAAELGEDIVAVVITLIEVASRCACRLQQQQVGVVVIISSSALSPATTSASPSTLSEEGSNLRSECIIRSFECVEQCCCSGAGLDRVLADHSVIG